MSPTHKSSRFNKLHRITFLGHPATFSFKNGQKNPHESRMFALTHRVYWPLWFSCTLHIPSSHGSYGSYGLQEAEDPHPSSQSRKLASEPSFGSFGFVVKELFAVLQGWIVIFFCLKRTNHTNVNGAWIITLGLFMHADIRCIYLYSIHVCVCVFFFLSISLAQWV